MAKRKRSVAAPSLGPDGDLIARVKASYKLAREHSSKWRREARDDFKFYAGSQWKDEELAILEEQQRPPIVFNRSQVFVDAIVGYEINNRHEVHYYPRTMDDVGPNEVLTNAVAWIYDRTDGEDEETDAFRDATICGMGWTERKLDDQDNPEYDIRINRVDPLEVWWDPAAKKPCVADANWLIRIRKWTRREAEQVWPGKLENVTGFDDWEDAFRDDEASPDDKRHPYVRDESGDGPQKEGYITIVEFQWREYVSGHLVMNPTTGRPEATTTETFNALKAKYAETQQQAAAQGVPLPDLQSAPHRTMRYQRAFLCGDVVLEKGDSPIKDKAGLTKGFSLRCITGKRDRATNTWFGMMRNLKDPQRWSNKWLSQAMHLFNLQAKGGIMAEKDAFDDAQQAEQDWADPSKIVWTKNGALSAGKIQPREFGDIPASLPNLLKYANDSFGAVTGVNQEVLGMADRDQPGVLEYQRKQSAVTLLAPLFDSLRRYRKIVGRDLLYMVQAYISDGRLIRIVGDDGAKYVPLTRDSTFGDYDVIVDQSASSPNVKEATWGILQQLLPAIMKMGIPLPVILEMLAYSPLPESLVAKLRQMMQEMQQQPPPPDPEQQKAQAQIEAMKQQAQIRQQESQAQMQADAQKHQADLQFQREKHDQTMQLEAHKATMQTELERQKAEAQLSLEQQKADHQAFLGTAQTHLDMQQQDEAHQAGMQREDAMAQAKQDALAQTTEAKTSAMGARPAGRQRPEPLGAQLNKGLAALGEGLSRLAEATAQQGQAFSDGMGQLAQAVMAENELVRDPKTGKAMGTRKRMPQMQ